MNLLCLLALYLISENVQISKAVFFFSLDKSILAKDPGNHIKPCVPYFQPKGLFSWRLFPKFPLFPVSLSSLLLFPSQLWSAVSPMLTHIFIFTSPLQHCYIVLYQLQLTSSHVGLRDISDHRGAANSLSASSLLYNPVPGPAEALSQAGQRDTWPNRRNTSSCRLPDAHHGENSGQRWRSSPRTAALPDISLGFSAFQVYCSPRHQASVHNV